MNIPIREGVLNGIKPTPDAGFTTINFLTASNQTNHDGPIVMSVQIRDQKLRLGLVKVGTILFPSHETAGHGFVPGPLCLIENYDPVAGRSSVTQSIIAEVVHVLYEGFHLLAHFALPDFFLSSLQSLDFITGQRFTQYSNEWTIAGKKNRIGLLVIGALFSGDIQTYERFSSARHPRHKDDVLFSLACSLCNQLLNTLGCDGEISSSSIMPGNGFHRMPCVKFLRRFNNRRRGLIG